MTPASRSALAAPCPCALVSPTDARLALRWPRTMAGFEVHDTDDSAEQLLIVIGDQASDAQLPALASRFGLDVSTLRAFRDRASQAGAS